MIAMCLCFLLRTDPGGQTEVLLGRKHAGMGTGKLVGPGGHVEAGEDSLSAAVREVCEETGLIVDPDSASLRAHVAFRFPSRPAWDQEADVFVATRWHGELTPSEELTGQWFPVDAVPYPQMWSDARQWLPQVLAGRRIRAEFSFGGDCETIATASITPAALL
jgi:8-oxo-dGTP diphosphatase